MERIIIVVFIIKVVLLSNRKYCHRYQNHIRIIFIVDVIYVNIHIYTRPLFFRMLIDSVLSSLGGPLLFI